MIRKIIKIDNDLCLGCGLCVSACTEGAIDMVNGKAKLVRFDHCDGLGNCLPVCPTKAISFISEDTPVNKQEYNHESMPCGCPGIMAKNFHRSQQPNTEHCEYMTTNLSQWPVQIKLVQVNAPYFHEAHLLIAADCTAYAYGNFHYKFMKNKTTIIGCPKLDNCDYSEKLTDIFNSHNIQSITIARMDVPCCAGIAEDTKKALLKSGKMIPWQIVTITTEGNIV